jgi:hypothetical protein
LLAAGPGKYSLINIVRDRVSDLIFRWVV